MPRDYSLIIGDDAPNFRAETTKGTLDFHDYIEGKWVLLTTHPTVFTGVCSTELVSEAREIAKFEERNAVAITLAEGTTEEHLTWAAQLGSQAGVDIEFPIVSDPSFEIAKLYSLDVPKHTNFGHALSRTAIIIDPEKTVRWIVTYPPRTGRNFKEVLRVLDSLQVGDEFDVATPADWTPGDAVIVPPNQSNEAAIERFGEIDDSTAPYVRKVKVG
ncbi:MAG: redoxin domain-containing protein [Microbacteriaceae bacterium]